MDDNPTGSDGRPSLPAPVPGVPTRLEAHLDSLGVAADRYQIGDRMLPVRDGVRLAPSLSDRDRWEGIRWSWNSRPKRGT